MFGLVTDLSQESGKSCAVLCVTISACFPSCSFPYSDFQQSQTGKDPPKVSVPSEGHGLHEVGNVIKPAAH